MWNKQQRRVDILRQHLSPISSVLHEKVELALRETSLSHNKTLATEVSTGHLEQNDQHYMNQKSTVLNPGAVKALELERNNSTFDARLMSYLLDGGKFFTLAKEKFMNMLERDEAFQHGDKYDQNLAENRVNTFKKCARFYALEKAAMAEYANENDYTKLHLRYELTMLAGVSDPSFFTRFGVHNGLFKNAIRAQGEEELQKKLIPLIETLQIYGCFAMTEMGGGSYTRGLETTATYDRDSQTFTIHTPTDTATKFWIGGAGQTATHSVVFARLKLFDDEKKSFIDYGVHSFLVQLRDLKTHTPMTGVTIGDIGKKMGRDGIDNGWIKFTHVKIPRENMLMKWSRVTPDGKYIASPLIQLQYAPLVDGRCSIVLGASYDLQRALTIAIRYACIRRQFKYKGVEHPIKLIDYQTHQYKLLPLLAGNYAMIFAARKIVREYHHIITDNLMTKMKVLSADLADLHNVSAGLKAFCTWFVNGGLEVCRQSLGGHGFSNYSGLSQLFNDFAVNCTWEGDNTVMSQQLSSYLVKSINKVFKNGNKPVLTGKSVQYLNYYALTLDSKCKAEKEEDFLKPDVLIEAFKYRACKLIANTALRWREEYRKTKSSFHSMNTCQVDLIRCAKAHVYYYMVQSFIEVVNEPKFASPVQGKEDLLPQIDNNLLAALKRLSDLFALYHIEKEMGVFLTEGYMNSEQAKMISSIIRKLTLEVRADAVAYVDAFNLSDFLVNSPMGSYDGDIYTKYFERLKKNSDGLNKVPYYEELIKPIINPNVLKEYSNVSE